MYIAEACSGNVRHLIGILKKIRVKYELESIELSFENLNKIMAMYR